MSCIRGEIGLYISDTRTRLLQVIPAVAMILHLSVLHIQKESTYRIIYVQVCVCIIGQQWHANTNRLGLSDTHTHTHSLTHTHTHTQFPQADSKTTKHARTKTYSLAITHTT